MLAIEDREAFPVRAGIVQPLDFGRHPVRLFAKCGEFHDADFFALGIVGGQILRRQQGRRLVVQNHLARDAQYPPRRAVVFRERDEVLFQGLVCPQSRGRLAGAAEFPEKNREAAEGRAAKPVDRLVMVADRDDIAVAAREQPEQLELRDIRVLKFVDEDVAVLRAHALEQFGVGLQQFNGLQQLRAEGVQVALAQQPLAHAVDARQLLLLGQLFFGDGACVGLERGFLRLVFAALLVDVLLVVVGRDELVLAAREKCLEVAQEFGWFGEAPENLEVELGHIAPQQNAVVDVVEGLDFGICLAQDFLEAERMERAEPYAFGAVARGLEHAVLHFGGGFVGEREPENVFAGEIGIRGEQRRDALGDHARLAGARARHHQQGTVAVLDGRALLGIQREAGSESGAFLRVGRGGHPEAPF